MPRYIDADKLYDNLRGYSAKCSDNARFVLADVALMICECPTADVVEVVRCEECKYNNKGYICNNRLGLRCILPHSFCSYGERKTS